MKKRLLSLLLTVCMVVMLFTGLAATASAADTIKGYLVSYTLQAGDTIYAVCEAKGIDFDNNLNLIAKINNITNYNYMMPGKQLWLPSTTATTAAPYYSLLAHTLAAGETPASLCQSYGVDYNASYNLLSALNNNLNVFKPVLGEVNPERVKFLVTQEAEDEIEAGMKLLDELTQYAAKQKREPVSASELVIGLKCGGSDGLSGITANPLLGSVSDLLTRCGGTSLLTEVPEMFGAETILMNRCRDEAVFQKAVGLINGFKEYFIRHGQEVYENPSPGNKAGGITTLEDKSLGCTQKGGTGEVEDVLNYCEHVSHKGLNLVYGPGNDLCAITALMAAGAHLVLFTTGRGTPVGAPIPTVKVATNTALAEHKKNWIDFNAGVLVQGKTMEETTEDFFQKILAVASGERTQSELHDYREIAIFKDGVTL